ncbi:MAG: hypothetical protein OEZ01_16070 [Candidatus Heimdallarchaeota archaeon]|nr:hypothetical protein [Candidatus Heimdallarchaeota archaeon]
MDNSEIFKEILNELKLLNETHGELVTVLSLLSKSEIEKRLAHVFSSSDEMLAYSFTDGNNTTRDVADIVKVSKTTISRWWNKWEEDLNIASQTSDRSPYKKKYSLAELAYYFGKPQNFNINETEEGNK